MKIIKFFYSENPDFYLRYQVWFIQDVSLYNIFFKKMNLTFFREMVLCKRFTNVASMVSLLKIESEEGNSFFYSENMKFINYRIILNASLWAILN